MACPWCEINFSSPPLLSPGWDGGAEVRDAGDEGHVHGGRRLPAARATAAAGAGGSSGGHGAAVTTLWICSLYFTGTKMFCNKALGNKSYECHVWTCGAVWSKKHCGLSMWAFKQTDYSNSVTLFPKCLFCFCKCERRILTSSYGTKIRLKQFSFRTSASRISSAANLGSSYDQSQTGFSCQKIVLWWTLAHVLLDTLKVGLWLASVALMPSIVKQNRFLLQFK